VLNLAHVEGAIDFHSFYARCYDLYDAVEFEDFIEEFKFTYAESVLKRWVLAQSTGK
jgi:tubulin monoglycylase TTLL3/8